MSALLKATSTSTTNPWLGDFILSPSTVLTFFLVATRLSGTFDKFSNRFQQHQISFWCTRCIIWITPKSWCTPMYPNSFAEALEMVTQCYPTRSSEDGNKSWVIAEDRCSILADVGLLLSSTQRLSINHRDCF